MVQPEESESIPPEQEERTEHQRLALRRISQRLKQLRAEFNSINRPGPSSDQTAER